MINTEWHKQYENYLRNFEIDNAYTLAQQNRPQYIYRYYELSSKTKSYIKNVIEGSVCFSDPASFNDPFDSVWFYTEGKFKKSDEIFLLLQNLMFPFKKYVVKTDNRSLCRCASFTEDPESILMWSHYAGGHTGICVGYNVDRLTNDDKIIFMPIVYTDDVFPVDQLIGKANSEKDLIYSALFKAKCWEYEKEWRLFDLSVDYEKDNQIGCFSDAIVSVYFGVENSKLKKTYLSKSNVIRNRLLKNIKIKVKNMKVSKDKFGLEYDSI